MIDLKEAFRENLISVFNQEILFFADRDWQLDEWSGVHGDIFGAKMFTYHMAWSGVRENIKDSILPEQYYQMAQKLFDMIMEFQFEIDHPQRPNEYVALISHPEWRKIQRYAREVYDTVAPRI